MRKILITCCLAFWLCACTSATTLPHTPTNTLSGKLTPYISPTPAETKGLDSLPAPISTAAPLAMTPLPSATPFTHTISKDDTLLGIAFRYGVSLEELQAANPGVDPGFLVIGATLIIPLKGEIASELPIPTPIAVQSSPPACYPSSDGGLWCFLLVTNDQYMALENLSGWVSLYDAQGSLLGTQTAAAPLNWLPPGASMPLVSFFSTSPAEFQVQGQLSSAVAVEAGEVRYLAAEGSVNDVEISAEGLQAVIRGQVFVPQGSIPASVWVAATAYDSQGNVVGMRKLDLGAPCGIPTTPMPSSTLQPTPAAGTPVFTPTSIPTAAIPVPCTPVEITVYSLGPAIQRVELLVEARP